MNSFIFQSRPEILDLRAEISPGTQAVWPATRYQKDMRIGDIVYLWMSGDVHFKGFYGWGRLASEVFFDEKLDSHGIKVEYQTRFEKPILATTVEKEPSLKSLLVMRAPQASNFLINQLESKKIINLILQRKENAPSMQGDSNERG